MNTPTTLAAYAAALAVVFGSAVGVGNAVGPVGSAAETHSADATHSSDSTEMTGMGSTDAAGLDADHDGEEHSASAGSTDAGPRPARGLAVSQDGYTLLLEQAPTAPRQAAPLSFRILGPDGRAVTAYDVNHDKELHLIVVRRDATQFQHLHPERDSAGRWTLPLTLPTVGSYKVFADFTPAGADDGLTLATDLNVAGPAAGAVLLPAQERTATVDGYVLTLLGDLQPGSSSPLTVSVSKDGQPVRDLQPYLGAYGHLVALREGDLAYLHVHPEGDEPAGATGGPQIRFAADVPSAGDYRLFLDFQHDGVVRTAAFSLRTEPGSAAARPGAQPTIEPTNEPGVPHSDGGHDS